jgi:hypothetical protein
LILPPLIWKNYPAISKLPVAVAVAVILPIPFLFENSSCPAQNQFWSYIYGRGKEAHHGI